MINTREKLTVLFSDNGVFKNISNQAADFNRESVTLNYNYLQDFIYVGFEKPINAFFVALDHGSHAGDTLDVRYYNGSSYVAVTGFHDDTNGFEYDGFVTWSRNQTDETKTTVNSLERYWYRILVTNCTHNIVIKGLNIVFSDDYDLKRELFEIDQFLPTDETSHILSHAAARDHIIQELKNDGRYKLDFSTGRFKEITSFDLLDIGQLRVASTYLTLSKIMMAASDQVDDSYMQKSNMYMSLYRGVMEYIHLDFDTNNDGKDDVGEELVRTFTRVIRR